MKHLREIEKAFTENNTEADHPLFNVLPFLLDAEMSYLSGDFLHCHKRLSALSEPIQQEEFYGFSLEEKKRWERLHSNCFLNILPTESI